MFCVWEVVKTPTIISNNPVYEYIAFLFLSFRRVLNVMYFFLGSFLAGEWSILHSPTYEDGTDSEFRNVGY